MDILLNNLKKRNLRRDLIDLLREVVSSSNKNSIFLKLSLVVNKITLIVFSL